MSGLRVAAEAADGAAALDMAAYVHLEDFELILLHHVRTAYALGCPCA